MSSAPERPDTPPKPQPAPTGIVVDRRLAWGLASATGMAVGSLGTWASVGPFSVAGTAGGGDGWFTLAIAVIVGVLVAVRRVPWLALPGAVIAGGIGIGDAVRFLGFEDNAWFSVSLGWGLILMIAASVSLAAWGSTALPATPSRQRILAGVLTLLAIAGAVALGVADRHDDDPGEQADTTLLDAAALDDESTDDANAAPADSGADETGADDEIERAPEEPSADSTTTDERSSVARKDTSIGVAATDEDVTFKVVAFDRVSSIATHEFADGPVVPAEGSKLYVATVTWKNNMTSSAAIFCGGGSTVLVDDEGRNFDPDTEAMLDIPENEFCAAELQPGFKQTVKLVFRTPKDATPHSLALWNSDAESDYSGDASYVAVDLAR